MNKSAIYQLLQDAVSREIVPGVSYSLIDHSMPEQHYIGLTQSRYGQPLTPDMRYDLASLTKVIVVTTRILQLIGDKKLALTDEVGHYLSNTVYPTVTIKNLLLHDSGLPADVAQPSSYADAEALKEKIKKTTLIAPIGQKTCYSDLNFIILGWIIEKIDQKDLSQSAQENIFEPLQMSHTGYLLPQDRSLFVPTEFDPNRGLIQGVVHDETAYKLGGISGNAGLFSTLSDLNRFVQMILNHGQVHDMQVLPEEAFTLWQQIQKNGRTLGWQRWSKNDLFLWHTGFTGTSLAIDLVHQTAFVCLTNRVYPTRLDRSWLKVRRLAISLFFGQPEEI